MSFAVISNVGLKRSDCIYFECVELTKWCEKKKVILIQEIYLKASAYKTIPPLQKKGLIKHYIL